MIKIKINNIPLLVDVADTDEKRAIGLSDRDYLEEDRGMLFIFEEVQPEVSFFMPGMKFPLDIIFIGSDKRVKEIYLAQKLIDNDIMCQDVLYVVETRLGWCNAHGIKKDDKFEIDKVYLIATKILIKEKIYGN